MPLRLGSPGGVLVTERSLVPGTRRWQIDWTGPASPPPLPIRVGDGSVLPRLPAKVAKAGGPVAPPVGPAPINRAISIGFLGSLSCAPGPSAYISRRV